MTGRELREYHGTDVARPSSCGFAKPCEAFERTDGEGGLTAGGQDRNRSRA